MTTAKLQIIFGLTKLFACVFTLVAEAFGKFADYFAVAVADEGADKVVGEGAGEV